MDFDGRELTRFYLEKQDLNLLLEVSHVLIIIVVDLFDLCLHVFHLSPPVRNHFKNTPPTFTWSSSLHEPLSRWSI